MFTLLGSQVVRMPVETLGVRRVNACYSIQRVGVVSLGYKIFAASHFMNRPPHLSRIDVYTENFEFPLPAFGLVRFPSETDVGRGF